ncbi:MAG: hypothetical protein HRU12_07550, partial [Phaeodactylibacter sp.]|nr:hypothetical protein [Phaeodactylibacter sp.]
MRYLSSLLLVMILIVNASAQRAFEVAIISDAAEDESHFLEESIKAEITALIGSRVELNFKETYTNESATTITSAIEGVYSGKQADVLIGVGILSSKLLSLQSSYPIPTIGSIQLTDASEKSGEAISRVSNYTYIISPFNIASGIQVLEEICRCEKLALLTNTNIEAIGLSGEDLFSGFESELTWLNLESDLNQTVSNIPEDAGGVYILSPLTNYNADELRGFFDQLAERKLPSFTLFDDPMLELGAFASFAAS